MDDNAIFGVGVFIVMPTLYCAAGQVKVAGLWHQDQPVFRRWKTTKPVHNQTWQTTHLPDKYTGRF
jgi:hypothetical protein